MGEALRRLLTRYMRERSEGWIFGMLTPDTSVLRRGAKFPHDPVYAA